MKKIADDIYAITLKLPFPATPELTLYFLDGETPAIIDTGLGDRMSMDTISTALAKVGKRIEDISYIINTHEHIEHFSGNNAIKRIANARVIASEQTAKVIEHYHDLTIEKKHRLKQDSPETYEKLGQLITYHLSINDAEVNMHVNDGDVIDLQHFKLHVIATPGHADGHICFYNKEKKILFTGDHLISTGSTFVGYFLREFSPQAIIKNFNDPTRPGNIARYIDSLKKIQSLDLDLILPSHGLPVTHPYEHIAKAIKGKKDRENQFFKILEKKKSLDLEKLTAMAYNEEHSNFLQQGAALGYLENLAKSGKIKVKANNETLIFSI